MWFNPLIGWILRSPFHFVISKNLILITLTGRKSGRSISTPTNYLRDKNTLWVISWRERIWWRNLRNGAELHVLLAGKNLIGKGDVVEEPALVSSCLFEYYQKAPRLAKYVHINLDSAGQPVREECEIAAQKLVMVKIDFQ